MRVPQEKKADAVTGILGTAELLLLRALGGGVVGDNVKPFKRIAKLCGELLREMDRVNSAGKIVLSLGKSSTEKDAFSFRPYQAATRTLMENAVSLAAGKRAKNRPKGSVKNPTLRDLVMELHRIAQKTGGKLTLGMNIEAGQPNGTLVAILEFLHRHFPGVIPAHVPYRTLQAMRSSAVGLLSRERDEGLPVKEVRAELRRLHDLFVRELAFEVDRQRSPPAR